MAISILLRSQFIFSKNIGDLIKYINDNGYTVTFGEAYRTAEQQEIYLRKKLTKTRNSNHLRRLAVDFFFFKDGIQITKKSELQKFGNYWESLNSANRWGGNFIKFYDSPHFEMNI